MYTGSCLCGGVRYRIDAEIESIEVCYCQQCRKAQGGPLATNAAVPAMAFHITAGAELLRAFASSPGEQRVFCRCCGSPILSKRSDTPAVVRIRVGTVNEPLRARPTAHYYTGSKCNWWEIRDDLPRFADE